MENHIGTYFTKRNVPTNLYCRFRPVKLVNNSSSLTSSSSKAISHNKIQFNPCRTMLEAEIIRFSTVNLKLRYLLTILIVLQNSASLTYFPHFQNTLDPHLYLSFPSHSRLRSSVKNFTSFFLARSSQPVKFSGALQVPKRTV